MSNFIVKRADEAGSMQADWGELTWWASAELGNSQDMTVGRCVLNPGMQNPAHFHPNCSEVLVVAEGTVMHAIEDGEEVLLNTGDTITIKAEASHYARNIGDGKAVLLIAFSSAERKTVGE